MTPNKRNKIKLKKIIQDEIILNYLFYLKLNKSKQKNQKVNN